MLNVEFDDFSEYSSDLHRKVIPAKQHISLHYSDNERESNRINDLLIWLIGFGSTTLSLSLIFVGVMFYRWLVETAHFL